MIFSLDVCRARKGDCLLIHYGTRNKPGLILIDGGPSNVYRPHLRPRLEQIRTGRRLDDETPLPIDLLMVSHIDDDHIQGIIELTGELIEAGNQKPPAFQIRKLWHNTFDDILNGNPDELTSSIANSFGEAAVNSEPDVNDERMDPAVGMVLAGVAQGRRLRDNARHQLLSIPLNPEFEGKLIMAAEHGELVRMHNGPGLTIAGPMKPDLIKLQKEHDAWIKANKDKLRKEPLASFTDTSIPNLSSIVVLVEAGSRSILLTGDARGDKILAGLERVGRIGPDKPLKVDILKTPHHGSNRNMEDVFFERVIADHYVFSGDGEHGNPERKTLEMLFRVRGTRGYTMHFTYPIAEIDAEREKDWDKERNKEVKRGKEVRNEWSAEENSLTALFEKNDVREGREYKVVSKQAAHVIDLLDPVGF
jgi:hypothetical protein